jgi:hypothetical protein
MSFALTRFDKKIILNKPFTELLAAELISNQISEGTILLAADEILLDPNYVFNYNNEPGPQFPGRYDVVLVADFFDSSGGKINLSGYDGPPLGPDKSPAGIGVRGKDAEPDPEGNKFPGGTGGTGNTGHEGELGGHGKIIKIFCRELKLKNIDIISNGGNGGMGGKGGRGGAGGSGVNGGPPGKGGKGGNGGKGGKGGNGGKIEILFCSVPNGFVVSDHLMSHGGNGGARGEGGEGGFSAAGTLGGGPKGEFGYSGVGSIPDVKQVQFSELWEKVSVELAIPA